MLTFYDDESKIPVDVRIVKANDAYFNAHTSISNTKLARHILKEIDKAERVPETSFKGRSEKIW